MPPPSRQITPSATNTCAPRTSSTSSSIPRLSFQSTGLRADGDAYQLDGHLTIKKTTRPVTLQLEPNGFGPDGTGGQRAGFSATTTINRKDYGVAFQAPLEGGGVVISDQVHIALRDRRQPAPAVTVTF